MADAFDLERLLVNPADLQRKPKRKKWRREYVRVPWEWVERLQSSRRVSTYRLALLLLYEFWRTGERPVVLSNISALPEGLSRRPRRRDELVATAPLAALDEATELAATPAEGAADARRAARQRRRSPLAQALAKEEPS